MSTPPSTLPSSGTGRSVRRWRRCSPPAATASRSTSASPTLYDLPRAVYFDDEIMQVWQSLGIAEDLDVLPVDTYEWFGADGETILRLEHPGRAPSGWEPGYSFYQPDARAGAGPGGASAARRHGRTEAGAQRRSCRRTTTSS